MAVYDVDFAQEMAAAGNNILINAPLTDEVSATRAAIYCSLVACEIAMKAGLEAAGVSVEEIRRQSHDLAGLLRYFDNCSVISSETGERVPASRIRSVEVDSEATIGRLVEETEVSQYPNEIRYGELLRHYSPEVVSGLAKALTKWVRDHISGIQHATCRTQQADGS